MLQWIPKDFFLALVYPGLEAKEACLNTNCHKIKEERKEKKERKKGKRERKRGGKEGRKGGKKGKKEGRGGVGREGKRKAHSFQFKDLERGVLTDT